MYTIHGWNDTIQACFIFVQCSNRPAPSSSLIYDHNIVAVAPAFISMFQVAERKKYQNKKNIAPKQCNSLLIDMPGFLHNILLYLMPTIKEHVPVLNSLGYLCEIKEEYGCWVADLTF